MTLSGKAWALVSSLLLWSCVAVMAEPGKSITVEARKISVFQPENPDRKHFVELEFLGGLELSSEDKGFGGISGFRMLNDDAFLAISDKGKWFSGKIIREGFQPTGLADIRTGRMRSTDGQKMKGKRDADAEGLERDGDDFLVSFERNNRALRFGFSGNHLRATSAQAVFQLNDVGLENNKGPEGIALIPRGAYKGTVLAFPEHAFNERGDLRVFMFSNGTRREFSLVASSGFSLTDATFMPNGDLLVLERRYSFFGGPGMRIRKFDLEEIQPGAVLAGSIMLTANADYEIDNMEGISATPLPDGSTRITVISDDNFSSDQKTLLLEFRLP